MGFDPGSDYPLGTRRPDLVRTPSGRGLDELTLGAVCAGEIGPEELRATPETLRRQSAVALAAGRTQLADNLARAAELAAWANRLECELAAPLTATFVREAAAAYAERDLLKADDLATV